MARTLRVKTDASYKQGIGFSVAYETEVHIGGKSSYTFSDSKFIDKKSKSTDAEVVGVAYGIVETYKNMGGRVEDYVLILESDCEHAVRIYGGEKKQRKHKLHQTLSHFLKDFNSWRINWIPRTTNQKANALAKTELRKAEDKKGNVEY